PAVFYARPHEIDLRRKADGGNGIAAQVLDIRRFGGVVRIELQRSDDGGTVEAEMSRSDFLENGLSEGEEVLIQPRRLRAFGQAECADFQI
ncbi:MAG: TOBE domain-containing protein, partial [Methylococcaceae bacterium]|nr:TOBE domain-containing protein [Methylococcaceae bacterium]